ncbi:MAG: ABC transporter permease [Ferruginibacter sp.]|nr:ABC transporter permease [Cytophagales bacterium]
MLKNYFLIGFRNLLRNRGYAILNIAGLAVGIAACLLIFTVVQFELSYDAFQSNYDRIYRLVTEDRYPSGEIGSNPGVPTPVPEALRLAMPQLPAVAALNALNGSQITVLGKNPNAGFPEKKFIENTGIFFAEPSFFAIFDAQWLAGNPQTALKAPNTVVLAKTQAEKYFGDWQRATGKYLKLDNNLTLTVTGIIADAPINSDFPLNVLVSYQTFRQYPDQYGYSTEWGSISSNHQVYLLLPATLPLADFHYALKKFSEKHYQDVGNSKRYHLVQPLRENHFDARYGNLGDHLTSKTTLGTLSFIGVLILIMACINFVNLATAQAIGRAKEVGVRKVLGGNRTQLMGQFLGETTLIVLVAVVLAAGMGQLALPLLSKVSNVPAGIPFLGNPAVLLFLVAVTGVVSLLSGLYPALVLSGFEPVPALKSRITARSIGGVSLRRSLVVTQFAISQALIIGTLIAVSQMNFIRHLELGFRKEAVYVVGMSGDSLSRSKFGAFKRQLLQNPAIRSVALANDPPSSDNRWGRNFYFDHSTKELGFNTFLKYADADYFKTYGLEFVAGRGYADGDTAQAFVVNETLLRKLGVQNFEQALGKTIRLGGRGAWKPIVGVVRDFKTSSVREATQPIILASEKQNYQVAGIQLHPQNLAKTTGEIKARWEATFPAYVYNGYFFDESIERFYRQENQLALTYQVFAGLAIFISCLGLYGLVSFLAVQKTKEIGIRKVLGASVGSIVLLLSREFLLLITLAFALAVPTAYYLMNGWLQNFVYRTDLGVGAFAVAIALSLVIAWLTIGYRATKAALANPVRSLRTE